MYLGGKLIPDRTPWIHSLSITEQTVGGSVKVTGINFGAQQGDSYLTVDNVSVPVTTWKANEIDFAVPKDIKAGQHYIGVVVNGCYSANALPLTVK